MKNPHLHRYWIEFDLTDVPSKGEYTCHHALIYGCGVTAYTADDALMILDQQLCVPHRHPLPLPPVLSIQEDVDVSTLSGKYFFSRIGVTVFRGTWFPNAGPYDQRVIP
jgi:hypothetical protein